MAHNGLVYEKVFFIWKISKFILTFVKNFLIHFVMNSTFEEFRNNVFCRRDSNQHKARQLWKEISSIMNSSDKTLFQTEWSHFMMGELDADVFSLYFDKYVKKYYS